VGNGTQRRDFAEFYRTVKDECLVAVLVSVGDQDTAQELVAEAFARRARSRDHDGADAGGTRSR
jgi:DNA-directed RNA polymerase specialized sigma24 family protein